MIDLSSVINYFLLHSDQVLVRSIIHRYITTICNDKQLFTIIQHPA